MTKANIYGVPGSEELYAIVLKSNGIGVICVDNEGLDREYAEND